MPVKHSSVSSFTFPKEISDHYEDQGKRLGEGGFAKVILAKHIATGEQVALKIMSKDQLRKMGDLHRAYREIAAMKKLCHQHISQLYQVVETDEDIYMVLEYAPGGELFDHIVSKEKLTEKEARRFFRQIVAAVAYIHDKGLAHRDLKPENMLLDHTNNIKLIDFGLSSNPDSGLVLPLATCCGSPAYAAPELIAGREYLGGAADIWSLGVVLYGLLCGFLPFDIDDEEDTLVLYQRIKAGIYDTPEWLSDGSIKLLSKLLETNAAKRMKINDLLQDEWMMEGYGSPVIWQSLLETKHSDDDIIEEMSEYYKKPPRYIHDELNEFQHITAHYHLLKRWRIRFPKPKQHISTSSQSNSLPKPILNPSMLRDKPPHKIPATAPRRPRAYTHTAADDSDIYIEDDMKSSPLNDSRSKACSVFEGLDIVSSPIHEVAMNDQMFQQTKHLLHLGLATPKLARIVSMYNIMVSLDDRFENILIDDSDETEYKTKECSKILVGDRCKAIYSVDGLLYDCTIMSIDRDNNSCRIQYDWYLNEEEQAISDLYFQSDSEQSSPAEDLNEGEVDLNNFKAGDKCYAMSNDAGHYALATLKSFPTPNLTEIEFDDTKERKIVDLYTIEKAVVPDVADPKDVKGNKKEKQMKKNSKSQQSKTGQSSLDWNLHNMSGRKSKPGNNREKTFIPVPPAPIIPDNIHSDEEALANMLMSWYLTGYNTGYYQGLKSKE